MHDRIVTAGSLFKGLTERRLGDRSGTIYRLYQSAFGITVVRAIERARAGARRPDDARLLGLAAGPSGDARASHRADVRRPPGRIPPLDVDTTHHVYVNLLARPSPARAQNDGWPRPAGLGEPFAGRGAQDAALP